MIYDLILTTLDSAVIHQGVLAAQHGERVAVVVNAQEEYSAEEYTQALSDVLGTISPWDVPRILGKRELSVKAWRQLFWKHLKNQVQLRLVEQRAELLEHLEILGLEVLEGSAHPRKPNCFLIKNQRFNQVIQAQEIVDRELPTASAPQMKAPKFLEQSLGIKELLTRKQVPESILVNQTGLDDEFSSEMVLLMELANILEIKVYDLDLEDGQVQFGITLDGKVRIKNGILKHVVFELLWQPLETTVSPYSSLYDSEDAFEDEYDVLPFCGV